jgi:prepilin-type N-terminal cleavage/methylation domain-containing protein
MRRSRQCGRHHAGVTLVELLVVLAILGAMALVVSLSTRSGHTASRVGDADARVAWLRRDAVDRGTSIVAVVDDSSGARAVLALPDGSVIADPSLRVDRLTGRRVHAPR